SGAAFQLGYAFLQCLQTFAGAQQYCLLGLEFLATDDIQAGERTLQHGLELFFHIRHGQAVLAAEQSGSLTADGIHQNLVQHGLSTSVDRWARHSRERRPVYHCSRWRPKRCGRKKRCASARYWRSPLEAMHRYGAPLEQRTGGQLAFRHIPLFLKEKTKLAEFLLCLECKVRFYKALTRHRLVLSPRAVHQPGVNR